MISESALKIATATMSREISQLNACDGLTTPEDIGSTEAPQAVELSWPLTASS